MPDLSPRKSTRSYPLLEIRLFASCQSAAAVRRALKLAITDDWGLEYNYLCEDLALAVGEAIANAWRHGCAHGLVHL